MNESQDPDRMRRQSVLTRYAALNDLGLPRSCNRPGKAKIVFPTHAAAAAALDELHGTVHTGQERARRIHPCRDHFHLTRGERKPRTDRDRPPPPVRVGEVIDVPAGISQNCPGEHRIQVDGFDAKNLYGIALRAGTHIPKMKKGRPTRSVLPLARLDLCTREEPNVSTDDHDSPELDEDTEHDRRMDRIERAVDAEHDAAVARPPAAPRDPVDVALDQVWNAAVDASTSPDFVDDETRERYRTSTYAAVRRLLAPRQGAPTGDREWTPGAGWARVKAELGDIVPDITPDDERRIDQLIAAAQKRPFHTGQAAPGDPLVKLVRLMETQDGNGPVEHADPAVAEALQQDVDQARAADRASDEAAALVATRLRHPVDVEVGPYPTRYVAERAQMPTEVRALAGRPGTAAEIRAAAQRLQVYALARACTAAGVELGAYDGQVLTWLAARGEPDVVQVIAGLIRRAHRRTEDAELHDLRKLFELQWDRARDAEAMWRAEDPEARALCMPDLGALLQWLMDRIVSAEAAAEALRTQLFGSDRDPVDPMPVFVLRAGDVLTVPTVEAYRARCELNRLIEQACQVDHALNEIRQWQERNPGRVKDPDHRHVPAVEQRAAVQRAQWAGPTGGVWWDPGESTAAPAADVDPVD